MHPFYVNFDLQSELPYGLEWESARFWMDFGCSGREFLYMSKLHEIDSPACFMQ